MISLILSVAFIALAKSIHVPNEDYVGCKGERNDKTLLQLEPKLVSETANGKKYIMQQDTNVLYFANITGTPYEMGYAYGKLFKDEIEDNINNMEAYVEDGFVDTLVDLEDIKIPTFIAKQLAAAGISVVKYLLQLNWEVAEPFIPSRFPEEMQGIADASGIAYERIQGFNMVPELIKAACSIVGAWSNSTVDNKLLTLRALDWSSDAPINKYPTVIVYHSTEEGSHPFSNIGYAGFIGSISAVGSQGVSIQEKVWLIHDDEEPIPTTYKGKPWAFVLRDLGQFGTTLQDMADTLQNTNRTCAIHMGMASAQDQAFEGIDYSWQNITFFTDSNYTYYDVSHPELEGIMYFDKRIQPSTNECIGSILSDQWGNVTWETLFRAIGGYHQTGDTQLMVADVYENTIYISYSGHNLDQPAYVRTPMFVDLKPFYGITGSLKPQN